MFRETTQAEPVAGDWGRRVRMGLAVALALQLVVSLLLVGVDRGERALSSGAWSPGGGGSADSTVAGRDDAGGLTTAEAAPVSTPAALSAPTPPSTPPVPSDVPPVAARPAVPDSGPLVVPDPGAPPSDTPPPGLLPAGEAPLPATTFAASAPGSPSAQTFAREFPTHAAARQRPDVPSSFHWAVIVGVNDYMGRTSNTIGSVSDAVTLRDTLYRHGWRGDQVLTLTDHMATHDRIVRAIEWLIRSTDENSTVIFSFSGHMKHERGVTALWPADNRFIWAGDLGRMLGAVRAHRLWASLKGCHAAGLAAPGLEGPNRIVTYASRVPEKAYEDPATGHSVMGYYLLAEGLRDGMGDRHAGNGDGRVSVQEAFAWAAPRATARTTGQVPYGPQHPVIVDGLGGREFPVAVTGAPPPPGASPGPAAPPAPRSGDGDGRTRDRIWSLGIPDAVGVPDLPVPVPDLPVPRVGLP